MRDERRRTSAALDRRDDAVRHLGHRSDAVDADQVAAALVVRSQRSRGLRVDREPASDDVLGVDGAVPAAVLKSVADMQDYVERVDALSF